MVLSYSESRSPGKKYRALIEILYVVSMSKKIQQEEVERLQGVVARRQAKFEDAKRKLSVAKGKVKENG